MYFFLGNILEYIKNAEHKIIIPIIFLFGLIKITVKFLLMLFKFRLEYTTFLLNMI